MKDLAILMLTLFAIIAGTVYFQQEPPKEPEYNPNDWRQRYDRKVPTRYTPVEPKPTAPPSPEVSPTP